MVQAGDVVTLRSSGRQYRIGRLLGSGGQGVVYLAEPADGGRPLAVKWYRPRAATPSQFARIERLLAVGPPSRSYLWPMELVHAEGIAGFGYVMPVRQERLQPMSALMSWRVQASLGAVCTAAAQLANAFLHLHTLGLCYSDISFGNVFIDPGTGEVLICDNDNVDVDGERPEVLGTAYFMAPEVVRGDAVPAMTTDRYSLAVLIFCLLTRHHPLLGARESALDDLDQPSLRHLLGAEPVFVFDPSDRSNRPVVALHDNVLLWWPALPGFVQDLFVRSFTDGLVDPVHGRLSEAEWRAAMRRLRGLVRHCPHCGTEQFFDPEREMPCAAPDCRKPLPRPAIAHLRNIVVLEAGERLFAHDLSPSLDESFEAVEADVVRHPSSGALALRNLSGRAWRLTREGRAEASVGPGMAVVVREGVCVDFGPAAARLSNEQPIVG